MAPVPVDYCPSLRWQNQQVADFRPVPAAHLSLSSYLVYYPLIFGRFQDGVNGVAFLNY
jgi:hypothetical protein